MKIFPAIDLREGRVVRLTQGDYGRMEVYGDRPEAAASSFREKGARCLHVVDLDGAKDGSAANFDAIRRILQAGEGMFVEVGGGIRDEDRINAYLDLGVSRVILGTVAVRDPDFTARMAAAYGDRIAVGVDARDGRVAVSGWMEVTTLDSLTFCQTLRDRGVQTVIYTDISRDGELKGANLPVYEELCRIPGLQIIASGGITYPQEIDRLREMGAHGVIVGKALYTGALELEDLLRRAREGGEP